MPWWIFGATGMSLLVAPSDLAQLEAHEKARLLLDKSKINNAL
jgi:hypothetical protein